MLKSLSKIIKLLILGSLFYSNFAYGIDCNKADTFREKSICNNEEFNLLDNKLNKLYKSIRTKLDKHTVKKIKKNQRGWLKSFKQYKKQATNQGDKIVIYQMKKRYKIRIKLFNTLLKNKQLKPTYYIKNADIDPYSSYYVFSELKNKELSYYKYHLLEYNMVQVENQSKLIKKYKAIFDTYLKKSLKNKKEMTSGISYISDLSRLYVNNKGKYCLPIWLNKDINLFSGYGGNSEVFILPYYCKEQNEELKLIKKAGFLSAVSKLYGLKTSVCYGSSINSIRATQKEFILEAIHTDFIPLDEVVYKAKSFLDKVIEYKEWGNLSRYNKNLFTDYHKLTQKLINELTISLYKKLDISLQNSMIMSYAILNSYDHDTLSSKKIIYGGILNEYLINKKTLQEIKTIFNQKTKDIKKHNTITSIDDPILSNALYDNEILEFLLESNINPNQYNQFGKTPLFFAVVEKNYKGIKLLITHGANVNQSTIKIDGFLSQRYCYNITTYKRTPLMYSVWQGDYKTTKLLLDLGADKNAYDSQGKKAFDYIEKNESLSKKEKKKLKKLLKK